MTWPAVDGVIAALATVATLRNVRNEDPDRLLLFRDLGVTSGVVAAVVHVSSALYGVHRVMACRDVKRAHPPTPTDDSRGVHIRGSPLTLHR